MSVEMDALAARYAALWNEPEPGKRRREIESLWTSDGLHFTATREFCGYDAIARRVSEAYDEFVASNGYAFRVSGEATGHHNLLRFNWEMVAPSSTSVVARGSDVLRLDEQGRVVSDHQFNEPLTARPPS